MDPITPFATKFLYSSFNTFTSTEGLVGRIMNETYTVENDNLLKQTICEQSQLYYSHLSSYLVEVDQLNDQTNKKYNEELKKLTNQTILWKFLHSFLFLPSKSLSLQFYYALSDNFSPIILKAQNYLKNPANRPQDFPWPILILLVSSANLSLALEVLLTHPVMIQQKNSPDYNRLVSIFKSYPLFSQLSPSSASTSFSHPDSAITLAYNSWKQSVEQEYQINSSLIYKIPYLDDIFSLFNGDLDRLKEKKSKINEISWLHFTLVRIFYCSSSPIIQKATLIEILEEEFNQSSESDKILLDCFTLLVNNKFGPLLKMFSFLPPPSSSPLSNLSSPTSIFYLTLHLNSIHLIRLVVMFSGIDYFQEKEYFYINFSSLDFFQYNLLILCDFMNENNLSINLIEGYLSLVSFPEITFPFLSYLMKKRKITNDKEAMKIYQIFSSIQCIEEGKEVILNYIQYLLQFSSVKDLSSNTSSDVHLDQFPPSIQSIFQSVPKINIVSTTFLCRVFNFFYLINDWNSILYLLDHLFHRLSSSFISYSLASKSFPLRFISGMNLNALRPQETFLSLSPSVKESLIKYVNDSSSHSSPSIHSLLSNYLNYYEEVNQILTLFQNFSQFSSSSFSSPLIDSIKNQLITLKHYKNVSNLFLKQDIDNYIENIDKKNSFKPSIVTLPNDSLKKISWRLKKLVLFNQKKNELEFQLNIRYWLHILDLIVVTHRLYILNICNEPPSFTSSKASPVSELYQNDEILSYQMLLNLYENKYDSSYLYVLNKTNEEEINSLRLELIGMLASSLIDPNISKSSSPTISSNLMPSNSESKFKRTYKASSILNGRTICS